MTKTRKEFTKAVYETIKDKALLSNISEEMIKVVEELPKEIVPGEVLFDGLTLFDGIKGIEDDIQQIHSITKKGKDCQPRGLLRRQRRLRRLRMGSLYQVSQ